jgi:hypothetical protein
MYRKKKFNNKFGATDRGYIRKVPRFLAGNRLQSYDAGGGSGGYQRAVVKRWDTLAFIAHAFTNGVTNANVKSLVEIRPGTGAAQRVGRRINIWALMIKIVFQPTTSALNSVGQFYRILIVRDRQINGTRAAVSDILLDQFDDNTTATIASSGYNVIQRDRFTVLYDKLYYIKNSQPVVSSVGVDGYELQSTTAAAGCISDVNNAGQLPRLVNKFFKLGGMKQQYLSDANPANPSDGATISEGALYLVAFCDVASPSHRLAYKVSCLFTDTA